MHQHNTSQREMLLLSYPNFLFAFSFPFEDCPASVYYTGQLNHMHYSKLHKLWVVVLSVPDVPHPDCLEDQCPIKLNLDCLHCQRECRFPSVNNDVVKIKYGSDNPYRPTQKS